MKRRRREVESRRKIVEEMAKSVGSKRWAVGGWKADCRR